MLLWSAVAVLSLALVGLSAIILLDVRAKGWPNWIDTLREWQSTIGTVAGFLSAAGVFMLSTAIQTNGELQRADRASQAIGQVLAYEVERMVSPLQSAMYVAQSIDLEGDNLSSDCRLFYEDLVESMIDTTPVYAAVLGQTLDFGAFNLAIFTRFYSFYSDLRRELPRDAAALCDAQPADRLGYVMRMMSAAFQYYQIIARAYPDVTPLQPGMLPES